MLLRLERLTASVARLRASVGPVALCFFCGVDSRGVVIFFVSVIGLGLLAAICLLLWSIARGDYRDVEAPKYEIFEAERRE